MRRRKQGPSVSRRMRAPNASEWTDETLALLGRVPDSELAARLGFSTVSVYRERRRRQIPAHRAKRDVVVWTDEMVALLGTDSDSRVAASLGIGHGSVARKRQLLGIAAHVPRRGVPEAFEWTPERIALLGTMPDKTLARELGLSPPTIVFRRKLYGIAPYVAQTARIEWTAEMLAELGTMPDATFAARYGISLSAVKQRRREAGRAASRPWPGIVEVEGDLAGLLEEPNRTLLREAAIGKGTASRLREEFGVDMHEVRARRWTPAVIARLGVDTDCQIARELGITGSAVRHRRLALGIARAVPPHRPKGSGRTGRRAVAGHARKHHDKTSS